MGLFSRKPEFSDVQKLAKDSSGEFSAPGASTLAAIKVGNLVRVRHSDERFWVQITQVDSKRLVGRVANNVVRAPFYIGDEVEFEKRHVLVLRGPSEDLSLILKQQQPVYSDSNLFAERIDRTFETFNQLDALDPMLDIVAHEARVFRKAYETTGRLEIGEDNPWVPGRISNNDTLEVIVNLLGGYILNEQRIINQKNQWTLNSAQRWLVHTFNIHGRPWLFLNCEEYPEDRHDLRELLRYEDFISATDHLKNGLGIDYSETTAEELMPLMWLGRDACLEHSFKNDATKTEWVHSEQIYEALGVSNPQWSGWMQSMTHAH